jgi:CheY-like chemotaxis protein
VAATMHVLHIDDNPGDARLVGEAFFDAAIDARLHVVNGSAKAMRFLNRLGEFVDAPLPNLIILDLELPGLDGRELLATLKRHGRFRAVPLVVLTSSRSELDRRRCLELGAAAYFVKNPSYTALIGYVHGMRRLLMRAASLPGDLTPLGEPILSSG